MTQPGCSDARIWYSSHCGMYSKAGFSQLSMYCTCPTLKVSPLGRRICAAVPRGKKSCAEPSAGLLRHMRPLQQNEVRLQARGVGKADTAQTSEAKARHRGPQLANCFCGVFATT